MEETELQAKLNSIIEPREEALIAELSQLTALKYCVSANGITHYNKLAILAGSEATTTRRDLSAFAKLLSID